MDKEYSIDLRGVYSREELHDRIEEELPVPGWYGRNLDALYDILTEPDYSGECLIRFKGCRDLRESMPRYLAAMEQMCRAAGEENPGLLVLFDD